MNKRARDYSAAPFDLLEPLKNKNHGGLICSSKEQWAQFSEVEKKVPKTWTTKCQGETGNTGYRRIMTTTLDFRSSIGMATDSKLVVRRVVPCGQASNQGIRAGMRVVAVGGFVIGTEQQLHSAILEYRKKSTGAAASKCTVLFLESNGNYFERVPYPSPLRDQKNVHDTETC